MTRLLSLSFLLFFLAVLVAVVMLYLVYGMSGQMPDELFAPIGAEATVGWHDEFTSVESTDEAAVYTGLGLAHGARRAWTISLWRQVALGRISEWYGTSVAPLDSLSLQLGLASAAREAFRNLPDDERRLLQAYAAGVNLALQKRDTRLEDEFALLRVSPETWEAWHSVAVERLFAWLAVPPFPDSTVREAPAEVQTLIDRSALLREFLAVHDLEHSAAFVTGGSAPHLGVRFVYGSPVVPLFEEHVVEIEDERSVAAVLPGTPFPFFIVRPNQAFVLLPAGEASISRGTSDTLAMQPSHERIADREGREHIVSFLRGPDALFLGETRELVSPDTMAQVNSSGTAAAAADTLSSDTLASAPPVSAIRQWLLRWNGHGAPSDAPSFRAALRGRPASFGLFRGGSVALTPGDAPALTARSLSTSVQEGIMAVGNPRWIDFLVDRIAQLQLRPDSLGTAYVFDDVHSTWAEQLVPSLLRSAGSIPDPPDDVRDALTYLRNWNFEYDGSNIAASIFDRWVRAYRDSTGFAPEAAASDTLFPERFLRYQLLAQVVDDMVAEFSPEMSQWRWEHTQSDRRYSAGFLQRHPQIVVPRNRRYDTIELPGRGHPSTPRFGTSPLLDDPAGAASWEAWAPISALDSLSIRRRRIDLRSFRGRYMISDREPAILRLVDAIPDHTTRLIPLEN